MIAKAQAQPGSRMQMRLASVLPLKTDYTGPQIKQGIVTRRQR